MWTSSRTLELFCYWVLFVLWFAIAFATPHLSLIATITYPHVTTPCEGVEVRHSYSAVAVCSIPKSNLPSPTVWNTVTFR